MYLNLGFKLGMINFLVIILLLWPGLARGQGLDDNLSIPLSISVWLVGASSPIGFFPEGGEHLPMNEKGQTIDPEMFEDTLQAILPFYHPSATRVPSGNAFSCSDEDSSSPSSCTQTEESDMQFALQYAVLSSNQNPSSGSAMGNMGAEAAAGSETGAGKGMDTNHLQALEKGFLREYAALIKKYPRDELGNHIVPVRAVADLLRDLSDGTLLQDDTAHIPVEYLQPSVFNLPVVLLAANDPLNPLPPHALRGGGKGEDGLGDGSVCSNSVVGTIAFYDNTVAMCDLLSHVTLAQAEGSSAGFGGASSAMLSLPLHKIHHIRGHLFSYEESDVMLQREIMRQMHNMEKEGKAVGRDSDMSWAKHHTSSVLGIQAVRSLSTRLAAVVVSAVQALGSAGHLPPASRAFLASRLLVPVIILRGRSEGIVEPVSVDATAVETWLRALLPPGQELAVVSHEHYLSEHPQVAVAIAAAQDTFATGKSQVPFLRSRALVRGLANAGDPLCVALLRRSGLGQWQGEAGELDWLQGGLVDLDGEYNDNESDAASDATRESNILLRWLHQNGHGEEFEVAQTREEALSAALSSHASDNGGTTYKKSTGNKDTPSSQKTVEEEEDKLAGTSIRRKGVSVFPVFVLSDVLVYSGKSAGEGGDMGAGVEPALLPLLDKDSRTAVHGNTILAVHSIGGKDVNVFNRATQLWHTVPTGGSLTDITTMVAAGLTEALTGVTAPYLQTSRRGVVDLTWSSGVHPFGLGEFLHSKPPKEGDSVKAKLLAKRQQRAESGGVYAWLGRRSQLASRAHTLLHRATALATSLQTDVRRILQAFRMLHVHTAGEPSILSFALDADTDIPSLSDKTVAAALLAFKEQNTRKRATKSGSGSGGDASQKDIDDASASADALLDSILVELEVVQRSGVLVKDAEKALLLSLRGNDLRRENHRMAVRDLRMGSYVHASHLQQPGPDLQTHRIDFTTGHLQPYINLLDALGGLEGHLNAAEKNRKDLVQRLRVRLSACSVHFHFVDNGVFSDAGANKKGMVADFAAVVERPEREKDALTTTSPGGARLDIGIFRLVWDYFSGRSGKDYAPDAAYRFQQQELAAKRNKHLESVSLGLKYGDHGTVSAGDGGFIGSVAQDRADSSKLFQWLRSSNTMLSSKAISVVLLLAALVAVPIAFKIMRVRIEQRSKKMK